MTLYEMQEIVGNISYPEYTFIVGTKGTTPTESSDGYSNGAELVPYLQACYEEPDIVTGKPATQCTRKWLLSFHMVPSEITQTALKLLLTSMEHRVREHFKYKGERVYGPHFDVEALVEVARQRRLDYRGKNEVKKSEA